MPKVKLNDRDGSRKKMKLNDIDSQIAALEQSSSSESSDEESSGDELERIPPLPSHLLPSTGMSKRIITKDDDKPNSVITCELCHNYVCFSKEEMQKHKRSMLHRQNVVLAAGAAYEPARKRPLYCRTCAMDFETSEELFKHREKDDHKEMARKERRASFCHVCEKQYTSANQLAEHVKGKLHKETLESKKHEWSSRARRR